MMRDIKFRGRALSNDKHAGIKKGDFVYGSFIKTDIDAPAIVWGDGEQMEVDEETVGQFIGRVDKNGTDIYEGDIYFDRGVFTYGFRKREYCNFRVIQFDILKSSFNAKIHCGTCEIDDNCVIEGDIHTTPNLLKDSEL